MKEDKVDFNIEWIPGELNPGTPIEGASLEGKFSKQQIEEMYVNLNNIAKPYNIKFENPNISFNTHRALLAGEYAQEMDKYNEFSKAIYKAIFIDIENIGDKTILDEIAKKVGLDVEEMNRLIDEGKYNENLTQANELADKHNIEEVPTFLINHKKKIINVRKYDKLKESIIDI